MVKDYWQILHKYTVNINLLIIGFDWVSKFTLSLLSALKVSITFGWAMNGIHCLNRSNRIHYWCYSNQWYGYIIQVYLHGKSNQKRWHLQIFEVESIWKWGGFQVKPQSFTSKANQREAWHWSDLRWIFTSKRGGIFAKIKCTFQIITLKESSISNTLYILGVNLFSLFSA